MKKWIQKKAADFHRSTEEMQAFYDRIHQMYWFVERHIRPGLVDVLSTLDGKLDMSGAPTVLEYCCGSGLLSMQLATRFFHVTGRDLSEKMLQRATRLAQNHTNITFETGNVLNITDPPDSFDFAFISFGLHLFGPDDRKQILKQLLRVVSREVVIIEHPPQWQWLIAVMEWLEGSHYTDFINTEWHAVAKELDAELKWEIIAKTQVLRWRAQ
ncbi:MAG: methyltransferase domain-containing protein [Deltaproteobacteria bacterium]|nr:methyltransferase domain-containing protein [Deltaproteobacteria bacterium]